MTTGIYILASLFLHMNKILGTANYHSVISHIIVCLLSHHGILKRKTFEDKTKKPIKI